MSYMGCGNGGDDNSSETAEIVWGEIMLGRDRDDQGNARGIFSISKPMGTGLLVDCLESKRPRELELSA
jgi:hypothetical protein